MIRRLLDLNFSLLIFCALVLGLPFSLGCKTVPAPAPEAEKKPIVKVSPAQKSTAKEPVAKKPAVLAAPAVTETELDNAEYSSLSVVKGKVKLSHGLYRTKALKGSHSETMVALTHHIASGKVANRDGSAAVLVTTTGGKGFYYDLAFMVREKGKERNIATVALGEQVKIISLSIDKGQIVVHMLKHKKKDPLCCPTLETTQRYELKGGRLAQVSGK